MRIQFGDFGQQDRIMYWFDYAGNICRNQKCCIECPLVGYKELKTDIGVLHCETARGRKDGQRTGTEGSSESEGNNDQCKE